MDVSAALPAPVSDAQAQVAVASANAPPAGSAAPALAGATAPAPSAAVASAAFTAQPAAPKAPAALGVPPPTNHQQQHPAPRPTVEQCRVLQQVIRLLENHEDAKKMVPLASMSPDMLQVTLANSPQPINVSDVLSKLIPHLDPVQAAQLWEQFRRGAAIAGPGSGNMAQAAGALQHSLSGAGCGSAGHLAAAASGGSGDFAAAVNQALPLAPGALNPAHAKLKRQAFAANGSKCSTCGETYHPSYSPLVLCDFCPSAHHVYCLGLDWPDLPEGEWACPRCLPLPGGHRGVMGLPARQRLEAERLMALERERQHRMRQAFANRDEKERKRLEERSAKEQAKRDEREKLKADAKRQNRHAVDDIDLAMEEAAEAARLSSLLPQLQDAAEREAATGGRRGAARNIDHYDSVDGSGDLDQQGLPPLPPSRRILPGGAMTLGAGPLGGFGHLYGGSFMAAPVSASDQFKEASDRLRRLQATAAGPPPLRDIVTGERTLHSLMDALAVAEFLATFSNVCGAPNLNLAQLQQAVAWPLDGPELFEVYTSLIKYLLAQWSHIETGHVGARVRRWARCLERSSAVGTGNLPVNDYQGCAALNGHLPNANATWQELLRRYCLLSRSSLRVKDSELTPGQEYATMSDDLIMVHAAVELGKQAAWRLPPEFHLRLLHALCNDVVNCYNMKAEISSRLDTSIQIQIEKFHADAEERKKEKEAARLRREAAIAARDKRARELMAAVTPGCEAGTPDASQTGAAAADGNAAADDSSIGEPPLKRARSSSGAMDTLGADGAAASAAEGTPGVDGAEGTPGPDAAAAAGWKCGEDKESRDAALRAALQQYMIRSEPLGIDRHHQRYWHMQSDPSVIFVESADGDCLGLITNKSQLDALMMGLNRRGTRENALYQALQKRYSQLCRCLRPPTQPLDVRRVQRSRRTRRNWLKQAAAAMPANVPLDAKGWPIKQKLEQQTNGNGSNHLPDYQHLLAASEATAVAAALSELEGVVSQLVGVGIYDLNVKEWRRRLRGKATVDELCQVLEEFEAALSRIGDGRPATATDEVISETIKDADVYEAEFVMPISAAELAEQQEAAVAAGAANGAVENAELDALMEKAGDGEELAAAAAAPPPPAGRSSRSKGKSGGSSKRGGKSGGSGTKKSGGKKAAPGEEGAGEDDSTNPDASALRGPKVTLFSGATRVRKKGVNIKQELGVKQEAAVKQEDGVGAGGVKMEVNGGADVKQESATAADEDITKMVSPLEELDDSDVEAEKRYHEKRAAEKAGDPIPPPPVVLWRSARELSVWIKDLRRAHTSGALGSATYAAAALVDRAHRLMANLALSRVRTGVAAAIAEDREAAVKRKQELLLGPTPWDEPLLAAIAAEAAARPTPPPQQETIMVTSTGRRVKGSCEPKRKMSARQRSKRGMGTGSDDEFAYGDIALEGDIDEPPPPPPEGKWGLACLACGGGGEVACCEVPGCSVLMHLTCAGMPDCEYYYCPDHLLTLQQPWLHALPPPDRYQQAAPPPVRPNVP